MRANLIVWNTVPDRQHGSAIENGRPPLDNRLRGTIDLVLERMPVILLLVDGGTQRAGC